MLAVILLSLFMVLMIAVGVWGMRKTSNVNDFFLGGRTVGPWITAFAYGTTYFSAVLFIGFAGKLGWGFGLNVLWIALGNTLIGALAAWLVLGRRTRRMTQNLDAMTMPSFLAERYQAPALRTLSAVIIFLFLLPYSASVFQGLSHLFEVNFNISYDTALLIMIAITGVYLVLGGYFAVTLTDFIQGFIMLVGAVLLIITVTGAAGGFGASISAVMEKYPAHVPLARQPSGLLIFCLVFMTSFGPWGLPQMVQKFYAIKNEKVIPVAAVVTTIFSLVISFTAYFNGALAHLFLDAVPAGGVDTIVPIVLTKVLGSGLLMAVILLLIVSASMSTLSSLILVSASSVAMDIRKRGKGGSLAMLRIMSGLFIIVSFFIARTKFDVIVTLMSLSWGVVAGSFMAPYVLSLFSRRVTRAGAFAGMLSGFITAVVLFYALGKANSPIASSIAMVTPFLVTPLVSAFTRPPDGAVVEKAFNGF